MISLGIFKVNLSWDEERVIIVSFPRISLWKCYDIAYRSILYGSLNDMTTFLPYGTVNLVWFPLGVSWVWIIISLDSPRSASLSSTIKCNWDYTSLIAYRHSPRLSSKNVQRRFDWFYVLRIDHWQFLRTKRRWLMKVVIGAGETRAIMRRKESKCSIDASSVLL